MHSWGENIPPHSEEPDCPTLVPTPNYLLPVFKNNIFCPFSRKQISLLSLYLYVSSVGNRDTHAWSFGKRPVALFLLPPFQQASFIYSSFSGTRFDLEQSPPLSLGSFQFFIQLFNSSSVLPAATSAHKPPRKRTAAPSTSRLPMESL